MSRAASPGSSSRRHSASGSASSVASAYGDAKLSTKETYTETVTAASSTANSSPNPSWKEHKPNAHPHPSASQRPQLTPAQQPSTPPPYSHSFWDSSPALIRARKQYFNLYWPGAAYIIFIILAVLSVFWGTLFKLPDRTVKGVLVDFDGGIIAQHLTQTIQSVSAHPTTPRQVVSWSIVPFNASSSLQSSQIPTLPLSSSTASTLFPNGIDDVVQAIENQEMFVAIAITPGASERLLKSLQSPDASYNGTQAVVGMGSEGRNENSYRTYLFPHLVNTLNAFQNTFSLAFAQSNLAALAPSQLQSLVVASPQTVALPAGFSIMNIKPFYQPIATAPVFTGLIFVLILAFFTVLVANGARLGSGLNRLLTLRSLVMLRLGSAAAIYFMFSFLYTLLNLAFGVHLTRVFDGWGVILFWLGTWVYMLGVGLVLESWVVLFKQNTPFFFLTWLIVNLSVGVYPLEMLPKFYHYGYGAPYYNITRIVRTIVFGTRNMLGINFGVLIAWVFVGSLNMIAVQWYVRRQEILAARKASSAASASAPAAATASAATSASKTDTEKA